jgi:hypothetical protein
VAIDPKAQYPGFGVKLQSSVNAQGEHALVVVSSGAATGTKTFAYNPDGSIASITGSTGLPTISFTYNVDGSINTLTYS